MERNTDSEIESLTETELRNAGASASYIAYYQAAQRLGVSTHSTEHAEKVVRNEVSHSGGGFHESLWNNEPRFGRNSDNPYGADGTNKRILLEAGVYDNRAIEA